MATDTAAIQAQVAEESRGFMAIYSAILLLIFHRSLVMYINSSYIEQFVTRAEVGTIYFIGSALTVLIFFLISHILASVGNYRLSLWLLGLDFAAVTGMAFAGSFEVAVPLFLVHLTALAVLLLNLDVFLEEIIGNNENTTGSNRGLLLALSSFIMAVAPLVSGVVLDESGFGLAYLISAAALVPVAMILVIHFRHFQDPKYPSMRILEAIRSFLENANIRFVFLAHLLLQIFFAFMVIYAPLYLATQIGLSWSAIGIILCLGQLAYVFFEYPIGFAADLYIGEREMMATGFVILAITTAALAAIASTSIVPWAIAMFMTRTGASLIEVTTESYFFKHTRSSDVQVISFFRVTRPLSVIMGSLLASLSLLYLPFSMVFVVCGLFMLPGIVFAYSIVDTK